MWLLTVGLVILTVSISSGRRVPEIVTCGYSSCNPVKDGMINVHLVPHTHDDVGWLKTVDQYYYGDRNDIQNAGVQYILDSVIPQLRNDPNKRFIYVEIAFFARWWREQHDSMRHIVKGLVNNGQLEFILGGWCMNDEASTHYNAIIDQHALGFEFLRQNFGDCGRPRVAWQIDPFGHSREQASLFAQMGFDGLFFGRLDYQDKASRLKHTTMEMLWHGSPNNLGEKSDLFTGALYNGYGPPGGFCWDINCQDEPIMVSVNHYQTEVFNNFIISLGSRGDLFTGVLPNIYQPPAGFCFDLFCPDHPIMDDDRLHDYNVDKKVGDFIKAVHDQAQHYATEHIVMTMGSDFQYQSANHWYKNMDKLIEHTNKLQMTNNSKINLLYSTPSCYLAQLNKAGRQWPTKQDDFFPYAHRAHSFWTGYFTSRAALKGMVRHTNNILQVCKQLDALAGLNDDDNSTYNIQILKEAMGVAQHHDAVSGTEKQAVAYDYAERLALGTYECQKVMTDAYKKLLPKGSMAVPPQQYCNLLNISKCSFTEVNKKFVLTVYNPLGHTLSSWIRLPVIGYAYVIMGPDSRPVEAQIVPISEATMHIPERNGSLARNELVFKVTLPALGFSSYYVQMSSSRRMKKVQRSEQNSLPLQEDVTLENQHISLSFDGNTGKLKSMRNIISGIELPVSQEILYYHAHPGNCSKDIFESSGAYIFRPNTSQPHPFTSPVRTYMAQGRLVQEIHQIFSPWATQVVRLYEGEKYAEFEWTVGPIPIQDKIGKEVISRFTTNLKTNKLWYTDANGREILQRKRDFRATWTLNQTEPVAGNYYPVNSRIYIQDPESKTQFTVLTDRSEGGASIQDGQLELMLHRRTLFDDHLGAGEPLNETGSDGKGLIVRGKHLVVLETIEQSAQIHRELALQQYMAPVPSFTTTDLKWSEWTQNFRTAWSGMGGQLPANVHILTLEQWGGPTFPDPSATQPYLLRLEHFYEKGEDPELSQPATVSLKNLFIPFTIASVEELTLGANLRLGDLHRLKWNVQSDEEAEDESTDLQFEEDPLEVVLNPMEIRTFQVNLATSRTKSSADKFSVFS